MEIAVIRNWLALFNEEILANKDYLSELDTPIGDGDHGSNMARGTVEMQKALEEANPQSLAELFKLAGMTLVSKIGGASGALYGSAFLNMAKAAVQSNDLFVILEAGLQGIQTRGKATRGEKTMVDTWAPVVEALANHSLTLESIADFANATKAMQATKGRASYVGERSIGHLDPGAVSSQYFFETMVKAGVVNE